MDFFFLLFFYKEKVTSVGIVVTRSIEFTRRTIEIGEVNKRSFA
jgi:hypothetical protein